MTEPVVNLIGISKQFGATRSLDGVDLDLYPGEIHALLGENGAGKSTLARIVSGAYEPTSGQLLYKGKATRWRDPRQARRAGIYAIHQELALFPDLSVAENIMVGSERLRARIIDHRSLERDAKAALERLGSDIDVQTMAGALSVADQQIVEIARAMVRRFDVIIFDEPTAVISGRKVELLFENMRRLKADGVAIIYVSHRLEELFEVTDKVTVLKDGRKVGTRTTSDVDRDTLVTMMVGRELKDIYPPKASAAPGPEVLRATEIASGRMVNNVSLALRRGEILGLAGMVGSGRSEFAHAVFGSAAFDHGSLTLEGKPVRFASPHQAIRAGIGLLTEDRKREGLFLLLSVAANVVAPKLSDVFRGGVLDRSRERDIAEQSMRTFAVAARSPNQEVRYLSGGNQQKTLFARWSRVVQRVLILDEPTRGVDIGAKVEIYQLIRTLADSGIGVLVISSDLLEVIGLCDRVVVLRRGESVGELEGEALTEENIMRLAVADGSAGATKAAEAIQ
jgi:ABC-type sugar transport system ATPase subunit